LLRKRLQCKMKRGKRQREQKKSMELDVFKVPIFSSLLTIGDSFAINLNLLAQKEKNLHWRTDLAWAGVECSV
jgi:hypothetical protein